MLVTEFGILIEMSSELPEKAYPPMFFTELGTVVFLHPVCKVLYRVSMIALQLFLLSYLGLSSSTFIEVRLEQPEKTASPIFVTDFGIVIEMSFEQPEKANFPMLVTELEIVIVVRREHSANALSPMFVTELGIVREVSLEQP